MNSWVLLLICTVCSASNRLLPFPSPSTLFNKERSISLPNERANFNLLNSDDVPWITLLGTGRFCKMRCSLFGVVYSTYITVCSSCRSSEDSIQWNQPPSGTTYPKVQYVGKNQPEWWAMHCTRPCSSSTTSNPTHTACSCLQKTSWDLFHRYHSKLLQDLCRKQLGLLETKHINKPRDLGIIKFNTSSLISSESKTARDLWSSSYLRAYPSPIMPTILILLIWA